MKFLKYNRSNVLLFLFLMFTILMVVCSFRSSGHTPTAKKGILDLSEWEFREHNVIRMDGEWEFYWMKFLVYRDLEQQKSIGYLKVPKTWNNTKIEGEKISGKGYATYRLHVIAGKNTNQQLGFRIYPFSSAYRLYVNEKLIAANGMAAKSAQEETGEYRVNTVFFWPPAQEFDIIIQVSNFEYAKGGFWYSISMGTQTQIMRLHDLIMGKEVFLAGTLSIISLFYIAMFIMMKELKYSIIFSILCFFMILSMDMVGQYLLVRIFPQLRLSHVIFIWYSALTWSNFFLVLFMHELYPSGLSAVCIRVGFFMAAICQLIFIFVKPLAYTRFADISNLMGIAGVTATISMIGVGIRKGYKEGWLNLLSILIVLIMYIHDVLYWQNKIESDFGEIIYAGIFLFVFIQMIIQARRIKEYQDQKSAAELSFLQAQIKPHFLYNAMNTFISISRYDMEQARDLLTDFSQYLRKSFDFKGLSHTSTLSEEIELAKAYVSVEKARFEERLEVIFDICEDPMAQVPLLMLQPVIENAINHGVLPKPEGGSIVVSVQKVDKRLLFRVKDNGIGLKAGRDLLKYKSGSGIGLYNINMRLKRLYGERLFIKSSPVNGTEVFWYIPLSY